MGNIAESVATWATALAVERWPEIAVGLAMLGVWRWLMGHKFQKRLEALERKQGSEQSVTIHNTHGTINLIRTPSGYDFEGHIPDPARIAGRGEGAFAEPLPLRIGLSLEPPEPEEDDAR